MGYLFLIIVLIALAFAVPLALRSFGVISNSKPIAIAIGGVFGILALITLLSTSFVFVDSNKFATMKRIYFGSNLENGQIVASANQKGPQAGILPPGFQFELGINITHDVDTNNDELVVPEGHVAILTALDGAPLREGQVFADAWPKTKDGKINTEFLDATVFLGFEAPSGEDNATRMQRGPQETVLPPGRFRINPYLWKSDVVKATNIPVGFVGVIKSNVGEEYDGKKILPSGIDAEAAKSALTSDLVPEGYKGIWAKTLKPQIYYINPKAYEVTPVDTRVQVWKYIGGYERRQINLQYDTNKGEFITDEPTITNIKKPDDAADYAIMVKVEGWEIPWDVRVQVQVSPELAPFVVASVGSVKQLEDRIITPTLRSVFRNEVSKEVEYTVKNAKGKSIKVKKPRKALDLLYQRPMIENAVEQVLIQEGLKAGVNIKEVRAGDPAVPAELMLPQKKEQLAKQMQKTLTEEQKAQQKRIAVEREKATADNQSILIKADLEAKARIKKGNGEKSYLMSVAAGQARQKDVLGEKATLELAKTKMILDAAKENPGIVKVSQVNTVVGQNAGDGATLGALLGSSNVAAAIQQAPQNK